MAGFVLLAVVMRPVGGWLSDRFHPARVLVAAFAVVAAGALVQSTTTGPGARRHDRVPRDGRRAGRRQRRRVRPGRPARPQNMVGSVTGVVGAAGGLGGFVPPLVMGALYGRYGSYGIGLILLAVMAAGTLVLSAVLARRSSSPGKA